MSDAKCFLTFCWYIEKVSVLLVKFPPWKLWLTSFFVQFAFSFFHPAFEYSIQAWGHHGTLYILHQLLSQHSWPSLKLTHCVDRDVNQVFLKKPECIEIKIRTKIGTYVLHTYDMYRVSHIEISESKWFWGVEGSIILIIFLWRHV